MSTDYGSPFFGRWWLGALFALLALAAGAISLSLNITFGLQTSVVAAFVFALSDCAKIMLPMVSAALGRWDLRRRIAWVVAVLISVTAALSSLLESEAQRLCVRFSRKPGPERIVRQPAAGAAANARQRERRPPSLRRGSAWWNAARHCKRSSPVQGKSPKTIRK